MICVYIYSLYNYGYIYVLAFGAYETSSIKPSPTARATGTGGTHLAAGRSIRILEWIQQKISSQNGDDRWEMVDDLEEKSKKHGKMVKIIRFLGRSKIIPSSSKTIQFVCNSWRKPGEWSDGMGDAYLSFKVSWTVKNWAKKPIQCGGQTKMEGLPHTKRWYIQQMMEFVTEIYIYIYIEYSPYLESPPCLYLCVYIYM